MHSSFAYRIYTALCCCILAGFSACTDVLDVQPEPYQLTDAEMRLQFRPFSGEQLGEVVNLSVTPVPMPLAGNNQEWDFTNLATLRNIRYNNRNLLPHDAGLFANGTFRNTTPGILQVPGNTTETYTLENHYKLTSNGLFTQGRNFAQAGLIPIAGYPGSAVTLQAQHVLFHSARNNYPLPDFCQKATKFYARDNVNVQISIPTLGYNQVLLNIITTEGLDYEYIGAGIAHFKGYGKRRALLKKQFSKFQSVYMVNGQPAPAVLMQAMRYTQNEVTGRLLYNLYAEGLG